MDNLQFAFYGDDFTGSTDALDALATAGVRTVLFTEPPTADEIADGFEDVEAIGIAGRTRSMSVEEMRETLPPAFESLARLDVPLVHYKVCSTFDSSPDVGSIGAAIDMGQEAFESASVPVLVGAPELGRYVAFGNHFATLDDITYRLDRHPVMKDHPVTPMTESDLRRVLESQTDRSVGSVDLLSISAGPDETRRALEGARENAEVVVFDTFDPEQLRTLGTVIWADATADPDSHSFVVGSSGVEHALATHVRRAGSGGNGSGDTEEVIGSRSVQFPDVGSVDRLVVASGSASPVTADQIDHAVDAGFEPIRLDTEGIVDPDESATARRRPVEEAIDAIGEGRSVVIYTARGPDDPAIDRTKRRASELGAENEIGRTVGTALGEILRDVLLETELQRACVAGGDTCGFVVPELGVYALELISPTAPGSPLCRATTDGDRFDGLQIALKGGQLGQVDYFERVRRGIEHDG